jgi:hypothetical protein
VVVQPHDGIGEPFLGRLARIAGVVRRVLVIVGAGVEASVYDSVVTAAQAGHVDSDGDVLRWVVTVRVSWCASEAEPERRV